MKKIVEPLLEWYQENKRELPWRKDKDPYHVWISEIMLQQTRIEAVLGYYDRFMKALPTIQSLSEVEEDELLKLWQGLGYYNRARNLKKAAIKVVEEYGGVFPNQYEEILKLPGIGEYTAGAISSICFNRNEVAVDGNVMRVYARINNKDIDVSDLKIKKEIGIGIKKILPEKSGDFNEGIMELGETICLPNAVPKCDICPLAGYCKAHQYHTEAAIPRKMVKKEKMEEKYTVLLLICNNKIALHKRKDGLLKNMWEFPNIENFLTEKEIKTKFSNITKIEKGIENTHIFTHKKWYMKSYYIVLSEMTEEFIWFDLETIKKKNAIPTAFLPFLEYLENKES